MFVKLVDLRSQQHIIYIEYYLCNVLYNQMIIIHTNIKYDLLLF